ncbi:MAG: acetyl-CoA carboxylase carboxyltransferase subunit beta [Candidatus Dormibacteria bacterium]
MTAPSTATTCPACGLELLNSGLQRNLRVCYACGHHHRLGARDRIALLADEGSAEEVLLSVEVAHDPLDFVDTEAYSRRLTSARRRTQLDEALVCARMTVAGRPLLCAAFDFDFMGGSMGAGVGERLARLFEMAIEDRTPVLVACASGGARMQEGSLSLAQMAKTVAALEMAQRSGVLVISLLCDPTMGGVMASFAALADVILAEPGATVGFAGRRVIYQATYEELPDDFQTSEYFLARGMIDQVVPRGEVQATVATLLRIWAGKAA